MFYEYSYLLLNYKNARVRVEMIDLPLTTGTKHGKVGFKKY